MQLRARKASARPLDDEGDESDEGDEGDEGDMRQPTWGSRVSLDTTCPHCLRIFSRSDSMRRHAQNCTNPTFRPRQSQGQPCTPKVPNWVCIVPKDVKFPAGARPKSAEVKFMTLSNSKDHGGLCWGGALTWTDKEMDAINARRDDGDNINTIIVCAMDQLTGDICVWTHDVDLELYGKYILNGNTFHVVDPEQTGKPIPPRHRWPRQYKLWVDHISVELASPPAVIIHLHPKGRQDEHYDTERPEVGPQVLHAYGLGCAKGGDKSLFHARKFLSTRA